MHGRGRLTSAGALFATAGLAIVLGGFIGMTSPGPRALLLVAIGAALAYPIARRLSQRRFDPFEPIVVFALAYGVMFFVRPLSNVLRGDYLYAISRQAIGIDGTFDEMLLLGAVGAIAFIVGYGWHVTDRIASNLHAPPQRLSEAQLLGVTLAFGALGLALFGMFVATSGFSLLLAGRSEALSQAVSGSSKYLYYGPLLLIPATLSTAAVGWRRRSATMLAGAAFLACAVLLMRGPVGSRITLLPLFGGLVIYYFTTRRRRPGALAIAVALLVALAGSAFLLGVRNSNARAAEGVSGVVASIADDPTVVFDPLVEGQDAAEAPGLAAALTVVPSEIPHTHGYAVVTDLLFRAVPRSLWQDKPKPPRERVVEMLWPRLYAKGAANPEFSALFLFFLDGGVLGVALGMLVYGVLLGIGYRYYVRHEENMVARLVFAASVPIVVILLRDSFTDTIVRALFVVGPILLGSVDYRRLLLRAI